MASPKNANLRDRSKTSAPVSTNRGPKAPIDDRQRSVSSLKESSAKNLPPPPRPTSPPPARPTSPPPARPSSPPPARPTSPPPQWSTNPPTLQRLPPMASQPALLPASRSGQFDKMTTKAVTVTDSMIEEMMNYFASDDCSLLVEVQETDPQVLQGLFKQAEADSKILIEQAGSVASAIQLCKELNKSKRKFNSVAEVTRALPTQDKACIDCRLYGGLCPKHLQKIKEQTPIKVTTKEREVAPAKTLHKDVKEDKTPQAVFLQEGEFLSLPDTQRFNVKLLGEYLTSKKCNMLSQCPVIYTKDLTIMLKGHSLQSTLNFVKFLDFRCQQYDTMNELYQTVEEVRETAPIVKKLLKEVINNAAVYRLPGWGQRASHTDIEFIFEEAEAGLAVLSHVREMLLGTTRYNSKEDLARAAHAIHEATRDRRCLDLENIKLWLKGERGEPCKLWNIEGKRKTGTLTIKDMRDLFRIENSSSGTVALLYAIQQEGKQFSHFNELLKYSQIYADLNQQTLLKMFIEKQEDIFRPLSGEKIEITLSDIVLLCEEGRAGPATINYMGYLTDGLKYSCFEEIYGVIKKLHAPHRNPSRIL